MGASSSLRCVNGKIIGTPTGKNFKTRCSCADGAGSNNLTRPLGGPIVCTSVRHQKRRTFNDRNIRYVETPFSPEQLNLIASLFSQAVECEVSDAKRFCRKCELPTRRFTLRSDVCSRFMTIRSPSILLLHLDTRFLKSSAVMAAAWARYTRRMTPEPMRLWQSRDCLTTRLATPIG